MCVLSSIFYVDNMQMNQIICVLKLDCAIEAINYMQLKRVIMKLLFVWRISVQK